MTKYFREPLNINNFRDKKAGNKFENTSGNKGTQSNFEREQGNQYNTLLGGTPTSRSKSKEKEKEHELIWIRKQGNKNCY